MTLYELKKEHKDIILDEVSWDALPVMANGAVLFYVELYDGKGQKENRTVLHAGHILTAGMPDKDSLLFIRATRYGKAVVDSIHRGYIEEYGRAMLFYTRPIPKDDTRNMALGNLWI